MVRELQEKSHQACVWAELRRLELAGAARSYLRDWTSQLIKHARGRSFSASSCGELCTLMRATRLQVPQTLKLCGGRMWVSLLHHVPPSEVQ